MREIRALAAQIRRGGITIEIVSWFPFKVLIKPAGGSE